MAAIWDRFLILGNKNGRLVRLYTYQMPIFEA
jgi:hypothetical protein